MRTHGIVQIYYSHFHPWFIPVLSFLYSDKTGLLIQNTCRTASVGEYARNYSFLNNLWLFLGFRNDDVAPIIEGVIGEKYCKMCNLYIGSCYSASNSSSLHKHSRTYSYSMATFLISSSFSKVWSLW